MKDDDNENVDHWIPVNVLHITTIVSIKFNASFEVHYLAKVYKINNINARDIFGRTFEEYV